MRKPVHYETALPHELDAALAEFPVAYVPLGTLEWHSYHLPLGTDALKANGILEITASEYGGVILPPLYYGVTHRWQAWSFDDFGIEHLTWACTHAYTNLAELGFKVIVGVTGHDVKEHVQAMEAALAKTKEHYDVDGFVMMENDLTDFGEHRMDHAGHWETALMMYLRPELVDMVQLEGVELDGKIHFNEWEYAGIGGKDPRGGAASRALGKRFAEGMARAIGEKAKALLAAKG